ncbi:MAG TPA: HAD-IB family phosphatase [Ignavibacteriaceae bacterium]|nr:HAD-IB family phosphatase [Ignavibacteriaceae bacterium]
MNERKYKIFVDFDGTITKKDVGDTLFRHFAKNPEEADAIIDKLLSDEITAKESWLSLCELVDDITPDKVNDLLFTIEVDDYFKDFYEYAKSINADLYVLSDGFDYYINYIFDREGIKDIKYFSNKFTFENNKLVPHFPYYDIELRSSANNKRNHILTNSSDDDFTIFVGDGNSDKFAAMFCDFIFAKKDLRRYCEIEKITYFPFNNFSDVTAKLKLLVDKKNLKKRHQATLKRREAYLQE